MSTSNPTRNASIEVYHIHAFAEVVHSGNPAAVCLLERWPSNDELSRIAQDTGPSVTAFVLAARDGRYPLRWFTRGGLEVQNFCGHATFSAAHVLLRLKNGNERELSFLTATGTRHVGLTGPYLHMTVPAWPAQECACPDFMVQSLGRRPAQCWRGARDYLLVFDTVAEVRSLTPDYPAMGRALGHSGVIVTAQQTEDEVVHRFFCPGFSIAENEDHATGSAMSTLVPFWTSRLGVSKFRAVQLSARGGFFLCSTDNDVITISSDCATFMTGTLHW